MDIPSYLWCEKNKRKLSTKICEHYSCKHLRGVGADAFCLFVSAAEKRIKRREKVMRIEQKLG